MATRKKKNTRKSKNTSRTKKRVTKKKVIKRKKVVKRKPAKKAKKKTKARAAKKVAPKVKKVSKAKKKVVMAAKEKAVLNILGRVTHYYGRIGVAVVELQSPVGLGDIVRLRHGTKEFVQPITSLQVDREPVAQAMKGAAVGMKVMEKVRPGAVMLPA